MAKARRRSTFGFVSAGIVLGVGIAAGVIEHNDNDASCSSCTLPEVPMLVGTALYLGLSGILTYGGTRAARRSGGRGFGILRVGGWITWIAGLAGLLVSAAISSIDGSEPAGFVYGSAILGALGPTFWAIDARVSAAQADEQAQPEPEAEQARHWSPALQLTRDDNQRVVGGTLGASFEL